MMNPKKLAKILRKHKKWLLKEDGGERANLSGMNLSGMNLSDVNLSSVNLSGANLTWANLRWANLSHATLRETNLTYADLSHTCLYEADLSYANLTRASLHGADLSETDLSHASLRETNLRLANLCGTDLYNIDLRGADLSKANLTEIKNLDSIIVDNQTLFFALSCPEKGAYIGYKKIGDYIVELEIQADALRSSATTRKCRASKARVLSITNLDGSPSGLTEIASGFNPEFFYRVGEIAEDPKFDTNRWTDYASGIHHFITRQEAVNHKELDIFDKFAYEYPV